MSRRLILWFVVLAVLAAATALGWRWRGPLVPALSMQAAPMVRSLQFSARVATASRVDLGSTVTGRVQQVLVAEGAQVGAGEVLLRLESAELQAALEQALANERQAGARLAGLRSTGRSTAQASVAQAGSVLFAAQADLERSRELVARGFVSQARLDEALRAVAVAQAQQDGAMAQRGALGDSGSDITQAQAQWAVAAAATAAARARLAQATLKAPADARVLTRSVEPGQIVQPGRSLFSLALAGPQQLIAQVDERFLQQLLPGQMAGARADAFPDRLFAARVLSISPVVDAQRGAVEVKFALPQAPPFLREDMTLSVEVETARREAAMVLPLTALRSDDAAAAGTVWLDRGGEVAAQPVKLGLRTLDSVEVLQGLTTGDAVLLGVSPPPGRRVRSDSRPAADRAAPAAARNKGSGDAAGAALSNAMGR